MDEKEKCDPDLPGRSGSSRLLVLFLSSVSTPVSLPEVKASPRVSLMVLVVITCRKFKEDGKLVRMIGLFHASLSVEDN